MNRPVRGRPAATLVLMGACSMAASLYYASLVRRVSLDKYDTSSTHRGVESKVQWLRSFIIPQWPDASHSRNTTLEQNGKGVKSKAQ